MDTGDLIVLAILVAGTAFFGGLAVLAAFYGVRAFAVEALVTSGLWAVVAGAWLFTARSKRVEQ